MLPTRPRLAERSMSSSCTAPPPTTATRVSCGVTLMRISSLTPLPLSAPLGQLVEEPAGLVERQAHDARVAAAQLDHEAGGAPLDRVGAGLVVAFAGGDVLADLVVGERLELHFRDRERALEPFALGERDRREDLVPLARERGEHFGGILAALWLAEDASVERDGRVGGEHRRLRQVALHHASPAGFRLGARNALHVNRGRLAGERVLVHFLLRLGARTEEQQVVAHADLRQQVASARA